MYMYVYLNIYVHIHKQEKQMIPKPYAVERIEMLKENEFCETKQSSPNQVNNKQREINCARRRRRIFGTKSTK